MDWRFARSSRLEAEDLYCLSKYSIRLYNNAWGNEGMPLYTKRMRPPKRNDTKHYGLSNQFIIASDDANTDDCLIRR